MAIIASASRGSRPTQCEPRRLHTARREEREGAGEAIHDPAGGLRGRVQGRRHLDDRRRRPRHQARLRRHGQRRCRNAGARAHQLDIKFDVDRERETFGQIVGAYKGNPDRYVEGVPDPETTRDPDHRLSPYIRSVLCVQMDLDFGSSPNLLEGPDGETRIGALQKSGVFHAVDAQTMDGAWRTPVAGPVFYGNGSTAAIDGSSIFVAPSPPGHMVSLDAAGGGHRWAMPVADLIPNSPRSSADGGFPQQQSQVVRDVLRRDGDAA